MSPEIPHSLSERTIYGKKSILYGLVNLSFFALMLASRGENLGSNHKVIYDFSVIGSMAGFVGACISIKKWDWYLDEFGKFYKFLNVAAQEGLPLPIINERSGSRYGNREVYRLFKRRWYAKQSY